MDQTVVPSIKPSKKFKKIYLEISNICNLQCSFCPEVERSKFQIEEEKFRYRLIKVAPYAERICLHVMGEPLGHPLFHRFVEIASELETSLEITTNGTLLNEKTVTALLQTSVVQVNFSLQSFVDNFPKADPGNYLRKIFQFCKRAFFERPDLYINFRLWNLSESPKTFERNEYFLSAIEKEFSVLLRREFNPRYRKSKKILNRLYLHMDTRFEWPSLALNPCTTRGTCQGAQNQLAVLAEGHVVPCCFDKEAVIQLGLIEEQDLSQVLEGFRYRNLVEGFEKNELREALCQRCDFARRFTSSVSK